MYIKFNQQQMMKKYGKIELFKFIHYYSPSEILIHYDTKDININKEEINSELSLNDSMIHINTNQTKDFINHLIKMIF